MKCGYHPEREAVGTCVDCGRGICEFCKTILDDKLRCPNCAEKFSARPAPQASSQTTNAEKPLIVAVGSNGQMELYEDKVRIKRPKGASSALLFGLKGDKDIYIPQISSIQYKSSGFTAGYIQLAFLGGQETKGGVWDAVTDENTVTFRPNQENEFKRIREALNKKIASKYDSKPSTNLGDLDKLAELRRNGIITDEEFNLKKKQILGI